MPYKLAIRALNNPKKKKLSFNKDDTCKHKVV